MSAEDMLDNDLTATIISERLWNGERLKAGIVGDADYDDYDRADRAFDRPSRDSETDHDKYLDYYGDHEEPKEYFT